jgi:hypothetical protein
VRWPDDRNLSGAGCGRYAAGGDVDVTVAAAPIHDKQFFLVSAPSDRPAGMIFSRLSHSNLLTIKPLPKMFS